MRSRWILVGSLGWLVGCASSASLTPELSKAESAVRAAREAGAPQDHDASIYLSFAENGIAGAKARLRSGDVEGARGLANRARADAEVAATIAYTISARNAARRSLDEADRLSGQLDAPVPPPHPVVDSTSPNPGRPTPPASLLATPPEPKETPEKDKEPKEPPKKEDSEP